MPINRRLMAEKWDQIARATFTSPGYSVVQREEMQRAFYAGAEAILFRIVQAFVPETKPTDEDLQIIEDLYRELHGYARSLKKKGGGARWPPRHLP